MKPYKEPRWLVPVEWFIATIMVLCLGLLLVFAVVVGVIGWFLGCKLYLDFRGETYEVRWFRAKQVA